MTNLTHISVAIPVLGESENLKQLTDSLCRQTLDPEQFSVYFCVNNPDSWSTKDDEKEHCLFLDNQQAIRQLNGFRTDSGITVNVIDRSSHGLGWKGKQHGVGWARKVLFDSIASQCDDHELIVSLDADTAFSNTYLQTLLDSWNTDSKDNQSALAIPYLHPLTGNDDCDRAILRYEIYMRHFLLSLLTINALLANSPHIPYAFTALGSAMAFPLREYKKTGGITPLQGGEDFYLLQKFAKTGRVALWLDETVNPSSRPSTRVPFGTGPAIAKGIDFINTSYPLYPLEGFQAVADTYRLFPQLYDTTVETPMSAFLHSQLKTDDPWQPLRKNFKSRQLFVHACQERVDGLRILQFLKTFPVRPAEVELALFCQRNALPLPDNFSFKTSPLKEIDSVRHSLFQLEQQMRRQSG